MPPRPGACQSAWEPPPASARPRTRGVFPPADRIALTGEVRGFSRLNRRPYGRGHGAQEHSDSGGGGR